jgi:glycosyltransferase involved in cell wall biosynthesis
METQKTTLNISPLITVIVAVYNAKETLQQCIDSVVKQSYRNVELIIIDGGSTDGSVDIIKQNKHNISDWVSEPDSGIYNAWNKGLAKASGNWIAFLGADDFFWDDQVVQRMAEELASTSENIRVVYGKVMLLNGIGEELFSVGEPWADVKKQFKKFMAIPHQGVFHKRELFEELGLFDESFKITGDYEFLLRELVNSDAYFVHNLTVTGMRQGGISSKPANSIAVLTEVKRAQKIHHLTALNFYWYAALLRVYIRMVLWAVLGERYTKAMLDFGRMLMGKKAIWTKT